MESELYKRMTDEELLTKLVELNLTHPIIVNELFPKHIIKKVANDVKSGKIKVKPKPKPEPIIIYASSNNVDIINKAIKDYGKS